jgi:hypothetical protein
MLKYLLIAIIFLFIPGIGIAQWKEVKETSFDGKTDIYFEKTNVLGHKLVIDYPLKRLIFIQQDKTIGRGVNGIKIDGEYFPTFSDGQISGYPQLTAIDLNVSSAGEKKEILDKALNAKRIEVNVVYYRDGEKVSVLQIKR